MPLKVEQLEAVLKAERTTIDPDAIKNNLVFFDTVYDLLSPEEKSALLMTFVQRVTYTPERVQLFLFNEPLDENTRREAARMVTSGSTDFLLRKVWLPASHAQQNGNGHKPSETAGICHEVPVAVTRLAHNRHVLSHRADAPDNQSVRLKPKPTVSMVEIARELDRMLKSGEASSQADLALQLHLTRPRVTQFLNLLRLAKPIQHYLIRTKDADGMIRERQLRPLTQVNRVKQLKQFRTLPVLSFSPI